jgi:hypothetical protein
MCDEVSHRWTSQTPRCLSAVALKCYQPPRSFDARGQLNLFNHSASISVLMAPELPLEILR